MILQLGLLLCDDPEQCEMDSAFVESVGGGGIGGFQTIDFGGAFDVGGVPDGLSHGRDFRTQLEALETAVESKRWAEAVSAGTRATEALRRWRGTVSTVDLFNVYFLTGVAQVELGRDQGWAYSFREAAAIADGVVPPLPSENQKASRVWLDELRKLAVSGRGTLSVTGAPLGSTLAVDGKEVGNGEVSLLVGNHRVTAVAPGQLRTWKADVPVLPGRISAVIPVFSEVDDLGWTHARLAETFATLDAPDAIKDLLVEWCTVQGVAEARLMRVEADRAQSPAPAIAVTAPPADRPPAAAGEKVNFGDAIPTTYEDAVADRLGAVGEEHISERNRLRVIFFNPRTRRFSVDANSATALRGSPERLRVGLRAQYLGMMSRRHVGGDIALVVPVGPIEAEGRLGLVRADEPYNLYPNWVDQQIYHVALGARWAPAWPIAPYAAAAAEVYIPIAVGGHLTGGVQAQFAGKWVAEAELLVGYLDTGTQWGGGFGLARSF